MNIIIFSTNYFPAVGGAEIAVKEITDRMDTADIKFDLITPLYETSRVRHEDIGNVTVHRVGFGSKLDKFLIPFLGIPLLRRLVKKKRPRVFWCIEPSFGAGLAYIYNTLPFLDRVPVVLTQQSGQSEKRVEQGRGGLIRLAWKLALQATDYVTAISSYLQERTKAFGYKGPIKIIPNGVDIDRFSKTSSSANKQQLKAKIGLDTEKPVLITTSRLVEKNSIDTVIRALPQLPDTQFLILGDGPLRESLEKLAKKLGIAQRVHFLGTIDPQEVPKYLHISDIFIRPSLSEGMGNSFIEAMAAKTPVIATPVGGIIDFLKDEETGLFVEVSNPESIARQVTRMMEGEALRDKIVDQAYDLVTSRYDWNVIVADYEQVFKEVASS